MHAYEVRPRKDKRGVDLISDALPFGHVVLHTTILNRLMSCTFCILNDENHALTPVIKPILMKPQALANTAATE
jgi:hypothetical protein